MLKLPQTIFLLVSLFDGNFLHSQDKSIEYAEYVKQGNLFYSTKEYLKAAQAFSEAVHLPGANPKLMEWDDVASCWALAGNTDSAFYYLDLISKTPEITYKQVYLTLDDDDYASLQKDGRWNELKNKLYLSAWQTFNKKQTQLEESNGVKMANISLDPIALGSNIDTAFSHVNDAALYYLKKKEYAKAYALLKLSIDNFPPNRVLCENMYDYYVATADEERAFVYFSGKEYLTYTEYVSTCKDCSLKIDSAIMADYREFSKKIQQAFKPPAAVVSHIGNEVLEKNRPDQAYALFQMNTIIHPEDFLVYQDLGSYYGKMGDKEKMNQCTERTYILKYRLPNDFFQPSFDLPNYFRRYEMEVRRQKGKMFFHSEPFYQTLANFFLENKMKDKAELLFQLAIEKYPQSLRAYEMMGHFYETTGNRKKESEFKDKALAIKANYNKNGISGTNRLSDTTFDAKVGRPVCKKNCAVIMIHDNGYWKGGFEQPFAKLISNDGFTVKVSRADITEEFLSRINVLVLACDPLTSAEVHNLNDWILKGGSLLAMTHHDQLNFDNYLNTLGIQTGEMSRTEDSAHGLERDDYSSDPLYIVFSEADKLLGDHAIINGRNYKEKIHVVRSYGGGKPLMGPAGSSVLLPLSGSAVDFMNIPSTASMIPVKTTQKRSFGVAFQMGKGKVVVLGCALIITAEIFPPDWGKLGMNNPGSDNKQFALNIVRWLTGYLK